MSLDAEHGLGISDLLEDGGAVVADAAVFSATIRLFLGVCASETNSNTLVR
ncbi:hypothetical protein N8D56_13805 [Devosia sp. A8/3-2]|nr:hypothetical protein N8D56_13805 [Devosia sp. A8/3-2]